MMHGNPLKYVEFMKRFKSHIHDKLHLSDDVRIVQLKMQLVGNAECAMHERSLFAGDNVRNCAKNSETAFLLTQGKRREQDPKQ